MQKTLQKLKEMSEQKELEFEQRKRQEEEAYRRRQELEMEKHIQHFEARPDARQLLNPDKEDDEKAPNDSVQLDEESGLKNYFREIVKNANRFGDKLDITHY